MHPDLHFEQYDPPRLTEKALLAERERRWARRQAALLAAAGLLAQLGLILWGVLLLRMGMAASAMACLGCAALSAAGCGLLVAVVGRKTEVFS